MTNIEYLPAARKDMVDIAKYIAQELHNPEAAGKLAAKMVQAVENVKEFPHSNPLHIPVRPLKHEYRKLIVDRYIIFYWAEEERRTVTVARVIYGKRDYVTVQPCYS